MHLLCGFLFDLGSGLWFHSACVMWFLCFLLWCGRLWISVTALMWLSICLVIRAAMSRERQENRELIRNSQKRLSGQSAVSHWYCLYDFWLSKCWEIWHHVCVTLTQALLCYQNQVKEVEEQNSQLQLQVKELNEEYRARLVCYIQDLTVRHSNIHLLSTPHSLKDPVTFSYIYLFIYF